MSGTRQSEDRISPNAIQPHRDLHYPPADLLVIRLIPPDDFLYWQPLQTNIDGRFGQCHALKAQEG